MLLDPTANPQNVTMIHLHALGKIKKKKIIFLCRELLLSVVFPLTISSNLMGQTPPKEYFDNIKKADSLYENKDFKTSADYYSKAFAINNGKGLYADRYNAACSWSLCNNKDSAFFNLYRIAEKGNYSDYKHITSDQDLTNLHGDSRWATLINMIQKNKEKSELNLNKALVAELDTIFSNDQKYRLLINDLIKKGGSSTPLIKKLTDSMRLNDSTNLNKVTSLLDQYGWLGTDVIGTQGNLTIFLVIQHADIKTQEKYLPLMEKAVKEGKASATNLAFLQDRVALAKGEKQLFGSQVIRDPKTGTYTVAPIFDEINVDKRRQTVGLESLETYLKRYGINYTLPQNK
jgi:hypothetical protein